MTYQLVQDFFRPQQVYRRCPSRRFKRNRATFACPTRCDALVKTGAPPEPRGVWRWMGFGRFPVNIYIYL